MIKIWLRILVLFCFLVVYEYHSCHLEWVRINTSVVSPHLEIQDYTNEK